MVETLVLLPRPDTHRGTLKHGHQWHPFNLRPLTVCLGEEVSGSLLASLLPLLPSIPLTFTLPPSLPPSPFLSSCWYLFLLFLPPPFFPRQGLMFSVSRLFFTLSCLFSSPSCSSSPSCFFFSLFSFFLYPFFVFLFVSFFFFFFLFFFFFTIWVIEVLIFRPSLRYGAPQSDKSR